MHKHLRAHHLFCIPLYEGHGYSDGFNRNMSEKIRELKEEGCVVTLISGPDLICRKCPNLAEEGRCVCQNNSVAEKDQYLLRVLELPLGEVTFSALEMWVGAHLNREIFEKTCLFCQWYLKGYCSYEKLTRRLKDGCTAKNTKK